MNPIFVYDVTSAQWTANTSASVNPVPSDQYLWQHASDGSLVALSVNTKEMAGGLISTDVSPIPAGAQNFGLDVDWLETAEDFPHKSRNEMDLKVTLVSGSAKPLPNQANGSLQWNATKGMWQLDPSGSTWADTGFTEAPVLGKNRMQSRFWSDGTKWSCTSLRVNGVAFVPGAQFQNQPMITTNWGAGLHPQLQTECQNVPWFLRTQYTRVLVSACVSVIGWNL